VDRVPYRATELASAYDTLGPLPVSVMLHNVRSLYNVGAFFRTADAVRIQRLYLSGITATPPDRRIAKTALGAEQTVPWARASSPLATIDALREQRVEIAAICSTGVLRSRCACCSGTRSMASKRSCLSGATRTCASPCSA
jgi:tRNA G18 (ribose-2'-O)-methylase SpoU